MKIEEANKLIAEFMGGSIQPNNTVKPYPNGLPKWALGLYDFDTLRVGGFNYHASWDWLMPVVEKIESDPINDVCIYKEATQIRVWSGNAETFKWRVLEPDGSSKIAHVYRAVIKYIQWYNTLSTPTDKQSK